VETARVDGCQLVPWPCERITAGWEKPWGELPPPAAAAIEVIGLGFSRRRMRLAMWFASVS